MRTKRLHPLILMMIALVFVGMGCLGGIGAKLLLKGAGILNTIPGRAIQVSFFILLTVYFYRLYLRRFEHSSLWEYATCHWFRKVLLGITIGSGLILLQVGFLAIAGNYRIVGFQPSADVIKYFFS
ncbi:MAG: hypothetical protein KAR40_01515 [Candidatus Sabulitectum sp.]|nr:hypothetical protein [Candidatus Sabulitectum sp.]